MAMQVFNESTTKFLSRFWHIFIVIWSVNSTICTLFIVCVCVFYAIYADKSSTSWNRMNFTIYEANGRAGAHIICQREKNHHRLIFGALKPTEIFIGFDYMHKWGWVSACLTVCFLVCSICFAITNLFEGDCWMGVRECECVVQIYTEISHHHLGI